jgi:hypothetical protein
MSSKKLMTWFSTVSVILILFGILYSCFGLGILPVNKSVLLEWVSALYGAIMMGWGVTLLFVGRHAFKKNDTELMKILLYGLLVWLAVEALFSAWLGVWFNVGVDAGVMILFSYPLIKVMGSLKR